MYAKRKDKDMKCPHCQKVLPETAVRCKYCRYPLRGRERFSFKPFLQKVKEGFFDFLFAGRNYSGCPWSLLDVGVVAALIAFIIVKDPLHVTSEALKYLRLHFFIFTKEPKLLYYVGNSINTVVFKFVATLFILVSAKMHRVSFWSSLVFSGKIPADWKSWMLPYVGACFVFRLISLPNPLVPNIPFNSVFPEAAITGNIVLIFSIIFVAPFVEEILFRGFLYPALNRYTGVYPAIIITSVLFTLAHYTQLKDDFLFIVIIFVLSFIITYIRAKTGSTWLAIIMHYVYNLIYVVVGFVNFIIFKY